MSDIYRSVLIRDSRWHYFFDEGGITLRFQPRFEGRVRKWLEKSKKSSYKFTFLRRTFYIPRKHEYYGVSFLGDHLINLFHSMSVLMVEFPPKVSFFPTLERLNHGLVNMLGIHDFRKEAEIYLDLADGRAKMVNYSLFGVPKWVYKLYWRIKRFLP